MSNSNNFNNFNNLNNLNDWNNFNLPNSNLNTPNTFSGLFSSHQYGNIQQPIYSNLHGYISPPPGFDPIHQPIINVNELLHTNHILNTNLITLNNIYLSNYIGLVEQINLLKRTNNELEKKINNQHNEHKNINNDGSLENNNCCDELKKSIRNDYQKVINRYQIKRYYPNSKSWTDEKINDFLKNMREIKDILKLKHQWYNVRHNMKLAKLCNLIPAIEKLDKMIGLDNVKAEIFKIIVYYIQNPHTDEYLHTVIIGPPGVGKTAIAKIYSDIFVRLGILKTDKFIEIKRDDLVGKYLGQTAPRTRELLESAMGGVVFLDEGYSLGNEEKHDSFAKEAIDMINQYLSERKKDFMFVIAGYEDDLDKCFFSFNRGLKRRFSHWIEISKYEKKELVEIFKSKVKDYGYVLDETLVVDEKKLLLFFDKNYSKFENYAGDVEKFLNYIKYEQSFRTFKLNETNKIIVMEDLNSSIEKFKCTAKYEPPFGLYV